MKITHIALWAQDLEVLKNFYCKYFGGKCGEKYINQQKQFSSYFIRFENDCALEIMHKPGIANSIMALQTGFTHIAFSVGSKAEVERITEYFKNEGITIISKPRTTGDGYYESVIADSENNIIEITE